MEKTGTVLPRNWNQKPESNGRLREGALKIWIKE
jgi:hypothetical protein